MNVETAVCFNQSLSPPLQSQGVDSQSGEPQRETQGDIDRYKEIKREETHTEMEKDFFPGLQILQKPNQKTNKQTKCVFLIKHSAKEKTTTFA